jgi:small ubiquitin-related modifier
MSSPPPESGLEKEPEASPGSGHGKEAEGVILKPVKPEAGAEEGGGDGVYINIKITSQTAPDVFVRIKPNVPMERMIDMYCGKHSLDPKTVLFLNEEGKHIRASQTAEEAGLEDGSSIDVHLAQQGGSGRASA